jgi:hypothetical protein
LSRKPVSLFRRLAALTARFLPRRPSPAAQLLAADEARAHTLADLVIEIESGGNAELFIPSTSALGPGQFLEKIWLVLVSQYRPDLAVLPRDQVLALRTDPALAREMVVRLLVQHSRQLRAAGLDPSAGSLYLAHFLGLPATIRTLKAAPETPILELVGAKAVAHNQPILEGKTAAEVRDWAERSMRVAALRSRSLPEPGEVQPPGRGA